MNWNRLKNFFETIFFIWVISPLVVNIDVTNYTMFIIKGFAIASTGALVYYGLDLLVNKLLKSFKQ